MHPVVIVVMAIDLSRILEYGCDGNVDMHANQTHPGLITHAQVLSEPPIAIAHRHEQQRDYHNHSIALEQTLLDLAMSLPAPTIALHADFSLEHWSPDRLIHPLWVDQEGLAVDRIALV